MLLRGAMRFAALLQLSVCSDARCDALRACGVVQRLLITVDLVADGCKARTIKQKHGGYFIGKSASVSA